MIVLGALVFFFAGFAASEFYRDFRHYTYHQQQLAAVAREIQVMVGLGLLVPNGHGAYMRNPDMSEWEYEAIAMANGYRPDTLS